ncbi:MAG: hypothetical protein C0467_18435 [Planctomycetaceae bacterium]|nr:hypothetical protein [Planctomycetaceae bacterium]
MKSGRRRALLSAGFLGLAVSITNSPARAQEGSHTLWKSNLTPDQVRAALAQMGAGESGLDPFQDMVKDYLLKNNPTINPQQAEDLIKKLTGDKQLMDQLKKYAKQKQTDPGRPGKLAPEDFTKLFDPKQGGKLPVLPPDLNLKGFGPPKKDPFTDPKLDPFIEPKVEPVQPFNPKGDPGPKGDPEPNPIQPGTGTKQPEKEKISIDKNPFPEPEEPNDARTKSLQAFAALWERNVGPLSETPEVQRALFEAIGENGFDFDMKDDKGNSIWDLLKRGEGSDSNLDDFLKGSGGSGSNWGLGNWELPKLGDWFGSRRSSGGNSPSWLGSSSPSPRPTPSGSGWSFGGGGGLIALSGKQILIVVLLLALIVMVFYQLKKRVGQESSLAFAGVGVGAWPVDPRSISTREDVVKAFEYLSVLICGPSAKNWTHSTIATTLADLATTHERTAMMLARLYELARYAPLDEALTHNELVESRKLVCSLAGVSY